MINKMFYSKNNAMFARLFCFILCVTVSAGDTLSKGLLRVTDEYYAYGQHPAIQLPPCRDCSCGERNEEPRVVGGNESDMNAFPWIARLIYLNSFGCGASLINDRYVISAAHCVKGFMWFLFRVKFGEHNRCVAKRMPETRYVVKMYVHDFTLTELTNDISLLKLNKPMEYSHAIRPVCLPKESNKTLYGVYRQVIPELPTKIQQNLPRFNMTFILRSQPRRPEGTKSWISPTVYSAEKYRPPMWDTSMWLRFLTSHSARLANANEPLPPRKAQNLYAGSTVTVAGWGATVENGNWSCTLMEAQLPVLSNEECQNTKYNKSKIKDVMMCAGYPATAHKDGCTGDSGGPLIVENSEHAYDLIGIVSWGYGCARRGYPGVYTRVTKYIDWIREKTADACYCDN